MIRSKYFRKEFRMTVSIAIALIFSGVLSSAMLSQLIRNEERRSMERDIEQDEKRDPSIFFAKLIDRQANKGFSTRHEIIKELNEYESLFHFTLMNDNQLNDFIATHQFEYNLISPKRLYERAPLSSPRRVGPPLGKIVRLDSTDPLYLFVELRHPSHPHGPAGEGEFGSVGRGPRPDQGPGLWGFIYLFSSLFISICLGVGISIYLLFKPLRAKVQLVDHVISEIKRGNLKVRFPIEKDDEVSQLMIRFNEMAEQIECLVEQLRSIENSRVQLFQELAHDIRTPISSLKNLLETQTKPELNKETKDELMQLSLKEVEYLSRLGEDFLLLAQTSVPSYHVDQKEIDILLLLDDEAESMALNYMKQEIILQKDLSLTQIKVIGDAQLLRRLFRNALSNAFSFASSKVHITCHLTEDHNVQISINDDGVGFTNDGLKHFGERKTGRIFNSVQENGRVSVGLGSVIMKAIVKIHHGTLVVANRFNSDKKIIGAELIITLPIKNK